MRKVISFIFFVILLIRAQPVAAQTKMNMSKLKPDQRIAISYEPSSGATVGIYRNKAESAVETDAYGEIQTRGAGLFAGSREKRYPSAIARIVIPKRTDSGQVHYLATGGSAMCSEFHYDATVRKSIALELQNAERRHHFVAEPTGGDIGSITVAADKFFFTPIETDLKDGVISTKEAGDIEVLIVASVSRPEFLFVVSKDNDQEGKKISPASETNLSKHTVSSIEKGFYQTNGEVADSFTVKLTKGSDGSVKVAYVGYDFAGSLSVGKVLLKSGEPFGRTVKSRLIFEFPVFLRFSPSVNITSEAGGTANMQYYRGELVPGAKGKLNCKLTKVNEQEAKYGGEFTMRDIGLATPQGSMKESYTLPLEAQEAKERNDEKEEQTGSLSTKECSKLLVEALTCQQEKKYTQAVNYYTKLIESTSNNNFVGAAYNGRGITRGRMEDYKGALSDYAKAIALPRHPETKDAYYNRANLYSYLFNLEAAAENYGKFLEIWPAYPHAWYNRAQVYRWAERYKLALTHYDKALELDKDNVALYVYINKGKIYEKTGKLELALNYFNKVLEIDPTHATAYYGRSLVNRNMGDVRQAEADRRKAMEIDRDVKSRYYDYFCRLSEFQGKSEDGSHFSITLIRVWDNVLAKELSYKFSSTGIGVGRLVSKEGNPFGLWKGKNLSFVIPVLVKLEGEKRPVAVQNTNSVAYVSVTLTKANSNEYSCRIIPVELSNKQDKIEEFSLLDISPGPGGALLEEYNFVLKRREGVIQE